MMSTFFFFSNIFESRLLQRRKNSSATGKGIKRIFSKLLCRKVQELIVKVITMVKQSSTVKINSGETLIVAMTMDRSPGNNILHTSCDVGLVVLEMFKDQSKQN